MPHTGYNLVTLGTVYNHWVVQVNRLLQVLTHRDKFVSQQRQVSVDLQRQVDSQESRAIIIAAQHEC